MSSSNACILEIKSVLGRYGETLFVGIYKHADEQSHRTSRGFLQGADTASSSPLGGCLEPNSLRG